MKNRYKSGFTIAELVLTTIIMAVVCVVMPLTILKRNVKPATAKKFDFIAKCTNKCIFDAHTTTLIKSTGEEVKLDYNKNSNEFYTIDVVGGGGGGTTNSFGFPGESKTVFLPSLENNQTITNSNNLDTTIYGGILTGYYLMIAGDGGDIDNPGGDSKICIISKSNATAEKLPSLTCNDNNIIALARGGIKSIEDDTGLSTTLRQTNTLSNSASEEDKQKATHYGWGGLKKSKGTRGVIIIK